MKRTLLRILLIVFIITLSTSNVNAIENDDLLTNDFAMHNQDAALTAYDNLSSYLNISILPENEEYCWPAEYSGCYIDENGILVICLTDLSETIVNKYKEICGNEYAISFKKMGHSLTSFQRITSLLSEYRNADQIRTAFSSEENKLYVFVKDNLAKYELLNYISQTLRERSIYSASEKDITSKTIWGILTIVIEPSEKKNLVNSPVTTDNNNISDDYISNSVNSTRTLCTIKPGEEIYNFFDSSTTSHFTLGIWATGTFDDGTYTGFITAGHCFYENHGLGNFVPMSVNVYVGNAPIFVGSTTLSQILLGNTYYDFAFVRLYNANYEPTTLLSGGGAISQLYPGITAEGTTLYIQGKTCGTVCGTSIFTTYSNSSLATKGYEIDNLSGGVFNGDSGGPVYVVHNNQNKLVGFQSEAGGNGGAKAVCALYAFNAFNATIYNGT